MGDHFFLYLENFMLNFFYDSLDTLKKVKKPTWAIVTNLTLIIFVVVIIAALMFAFMDGVFAELSEIIYTTLKWVFSSSNVPSVPVLDAPVIDIPWVEAPVADIEVIQPTAEIAIEPAVEGVTE